jgi:hypothetical protein
MQAALPSRHSPITFGEFGSVRCVVVVVYVRYVTIEIWIWGVCRARPLVGFHLSDQATNWGEQDFEPLRRAIAFHRCGANGPLTCRAEPGAGLLARVSQAGSLSARRWRPSLRADAGECSRPPIRQHNRLRRQQPRHPHQSHGLHPKRERIGRFERTPERFERRRCAQID